VVAPEPDLRDLPPPVRDRVLGLAASGLGLLAPADVPARLRAIARFAPNRRAELGVGPLTRALGGDAVLRRRLSEVLALDSPGGRTRTPGGTGSAGTGAATSDATTGGTRADATTGGVPTGGVPTSGVPTAGATADDGVAAASRAVGEAARLWLARPVGWAAAVDGLVDLLGPAVGARGRGGAGGPPVGGAPVGRDTVGRATVGERPAGRDTDRRGADRPGGDGTAGHGTAGTGPTAGMDHDPDAEEGAAADVPGADPGRHDPRSQLAAVRARARRDRELARREIAGLRADLSAAQRAAAAVAARAEAAAGAAEAARSESARGERDARAAERRARRQLEDLAADAAAARRDLRTAREVDDARLRLLLETLSGAVAGIERELGLPPATSTLGPADTVDAREPESTTTVEARASSWADPSTLERFLALPRAHLIVDGYNVTKAALPTLPLARQRELLVRNLAGLAARTGAEITVVFDGADVTAVPAVGVRGVRVRFSPVGVSADTVIRAMARAEPDGRPVVVVSSDREIAEGVRRSATPVPSTVLTRRLLGS